MDKKYFIKSELAERWGVSRQAVNQWSIKRKDFPRPEFQLGAFNKKMPVYHIDAVKLFEEKNNLKGSE